MHEIPGRTLMLSLGKRSKTFYLYRRVDGKPTRIMLDRFPGMTVEQARRKALSLLEGIENGTYGKPTTLGELWDVYCDVKRKKKSLDQDVYHYDRHLAAWSARKLDSISVADVQRLHGSLRLLIDDGQRA